MYPDTRIFIGTVEGFPSLDDVVRGLTHSGVKKVVLKPFMIVAGDHANNDMAGDESDSWKMVIKSKGIKVIPVLQGLGENLQGQNHFGCLLIIKLSWRYLRLFFSNTDIVDQFNLQVIERLF